MIRIISIALLALMYSCTAVTESKVEDQPHVVKQKPKTPKTLETAQMVFDVDGNAYTKIIVGDQVWMKENLRTVRYADGKSIPEVTDTSKWVGLTHGALCYYNEEPINVSKYGMLYNWYAVADSSQLCPVGWHVPSSEDWATLINHYGGKEIAGLKMSNQDSTGFNISYAGMRSNQDGKYCFLGQEENWWSSYQGKGSDAWAYFKSSNSPAITKGYVDLNNAFSVRCIKDK